MFLAVEGGLFEGDLDLEAGGRAVFNGQIAVCHRKCSFFFLFRATPAALGSSQAKGIKWELQVPVYTTATTSDMSQILNPLSKARDPACIIMDARWVCNLLCHNRNSLSFFSDDVSSGRLVDLSFSPVYCSLAHSSGFVGLPIPLSYF